MRLSTPSSSSASPPRSRLLWSAVVALLLAVALIPNQISVVAQQTSAAASSTSASASASGSASGNTSATATSSGNTTSPTGNSTANGTASATQTTTQSFFPTAVVPSSLNGQASAPAPGASGANTGPGDSYIAGVGTLEARAALVGGAVIAAVAGWAVV